MKNILVGIVFFMLVISGTAALRTDTANAVIKETSEPSFLFSVENFEDTSGFVIETSEIGPVDFNDITKLNIAPWPVDRVENCTGDFNFTVVLPPITANVYTDKKTYDVGEIVTYGIENMLSCNIGGVSVSIQQMVTCNWETLFTYYMPLLIEPSGVYESTWDQKGWYGWQVETGWYRVAIGYGYHVDSISKHGMGYAYFSIIETIPNVYTDKAVYNIGERVTYGIENTLDESIAGISVSIQKWENGNWENVVLTYYTLTFIPPGGIWESTWDQRGAYGRQVGTGMYRVEIHKNFAYFSITDICYLTHSNFPPVEWDYKEYIDAVPFALLDLPVNITYGEYTDTLPLTILGLPVNVTEVNHSNGTPFVIPHGYPWLKCNYN